MIPSKTTHNHHKFLKGHSVFLTKTVFTMLLFCVVFSSASDRTHRSRKRSNRRGRTKSPASTPGYDLVPLNEEGGGARNTAQPTGQQRISNRRSNKAHRKNVIEHADKFYPRRIINILGGKYKTTELMKKFMKAKKSHGIHVKYEEESFVGKQVLEGTLNFVPGTLTDLKFKNISRLKHMASGLVVASNNRNNGNAKRIAQQHNSIIPIVKKRNKYQLLLQHLWKRKFTRKSERPKLSVLEVPSFEQLEQSFREDQSNKSKDNTKETQQEPDFPAHNEIDSPANANSLSSVASVASERSVESIYEPAAAKKYALSDEELLKYEADLERQLKELEEQTQENYPKTVQNTQVVGTGQILQSPQVLVPVNHFGDVDFEEFIRRNTQNARKLQNGTYKFTDYRVPESDYRVPESDI